MTITVKTLLRAFISEVVEDIVRPEDVDKFSVSYDQPKKFEPRVSCKVGGAYWALRAVCRELSYSDAREFETRTQEFFHQHCKNIMDAYDGLDLSEYQD